MDLNSSASSDNQMLKQFEQISIQDIDDKLMKKLKIFSKEHAASVNIEMSKEMENILNNIKQKDNFKVVKYI